MKIFDVNISNLNISEELKDEFNFYQDKVNQNFLSVKLHLENKNKSNLFKFECKFRKVDSLEVISSHKFFVAFLLFINESCLNLSIFDNKSSTNTQKISELSFLWSLVIDFNFEEFKINIEQLKTLSRKIQKSIKPKKEKMKNEKIDEVVNYLKLFYVDENDDSLKGKKYEKFSIIKSNSDSKIKFNNTNKSSFLPIFYTLDYEFDADIEKNKEVLNDVKQSNKHLPDFLFQFIHSYTCSFYFSHVNIDKIYPFYEETIFKEQLKCF